MSSTFSGEKISVALSSMAASAVMTVGKLVVGLMTGSLGILSEALHSLLDFGATVMTYLAVRVSDKPADPEHPYGHGKIESVAALAETGLLFITSVWIVYEAVHRLIAGPTMVDVTWWSIAVLVVAIAIDISRARALSRVAKKTNSQALEADALHFSSDVLSSGVVLIGLGFVAIGFPVADPLAAMGVALFVCRAGWRLGKRTIDTLIDAAPHGAIERVTMIAAKVRGVAAVTRLRLRPAGSVLFIDAEIAVGRGLPQARVDAIKKDVIDALKAEMPEAETTVASHPLALDDETVHERVMIIARNHGAAVHHITVHQANAHLMVGLDLEVDGTLTLRQAHGIASHLENDIRDEFGGDIDVETHIEPLQTCESVGGDVPPDELHALKDLIKRLGQETPFVHDVHKVRAKQSDAGLFVVFHSRVDGNRSVADVHQAMDDLERAIRSNHSGIWRIVGHAEPAISRCKTC
jgi:cation diffusion facilitator family transporter